MQVVVVPGKTHSQFNDSSFFLAELTFSLRKLFFLLKEKNTLKGK